MQEALKRILEIQEVDTGMMQLMDLKKKRQDELNTINSVKNGLRQQSKAKETEILELKKNIRLAEGEIGELAAKFKKLESQQHTIKKVEEFKAFNDEMSHMDRERIAREQRLGELYERLSAEEETLQNLQRSLETTIEKNLPIETEILDAVARINAEGRTMAAQRNEMVALADPEVFRIYERLLRNKKDRVVVPIENRCCTGCHIMITAQDENLVRKGEHLVFCEHCSRIHYWQESQVAATGTATKPRRRRSTAKT